MEKKIEKKEDLSFTGFNKQVIRKYENITEVLLGKRITHPFLKILLKTKCSANQVSFSGLIFAIITAALFAVGEQPYLWIGIIPFILSYVSDCADGKIATFRKQKSPFGSWMDNTCDRFRDVLLMIGITIGVYRFMPEPHVLIIGFIGALHFLMYQYIGILNELELSQGTRIPPVFMLKNRKFLGANIFFGGSSTTYWMMMIAAGFNIFYYFLWFFVFWGAVLWMARIYKGLQIGIPLHKRTLVENQKKDKIIPD